MSRPLQPHMVVDTLPTRRPSFTPSEMRGPKPPLKWVDDDHYCAMVLQLPQHTTEAEFDNQLKQEAKGLGISSLRIITDIELDTASLSGTTVASDPNHQSSILSPSTAPTSCSSSDHRPPTSSTHHSAESAPVSPVTPSILADIEKKRKSGFRNGIRKMAVFGRKRKSPTVSSPKLLETEKGNHQGWDGSRSATDTTLKAIDFELYDSNSVRPHSKSHSVRSNESSSLWSNRVSATTKSSYDNTDTLIDHEALRRTMESVEMIALRDRQQEERQRFLQYQAQLLTALHMERDQIKEEKTKHHKDILEEHMEKTDKTIEDMESRQLEDELKMVRDHESEKKAILTRLRHMEAYCQNPSPPPTPIEPNFVGSDGATSSISMTRGTSDSANVNVTMILPERKVTDKDYHNLASCYRERDAMDNLHASKINVLRGKQKRAVENFMLRKEKEFEKLEVLQGKEIDEVDREFGVKEAECRAEFWDKRQVLERRWKLQAIIEKVKAEKKTGLTYEVLPALVLDGKDVEGGGYGIAR